MDSARTNCPGRGQDILKRYPVSLCSGGVGIDTDMKETSWQKITNVSLSVLHIKDSACARKVPDTEIWEKASVT